MGRFSLERDFLIQVRSGMEYSKLNPPKSVRAGPYIKQPTGYRAFIPKPLPPNPPIPIEGDLQVLLSQADRALGRLDSSIQTLPHPDLFVYMYVRNPQSQVHV